MDFAKVNLGQVEAANQPAIKQGKNAEPRQNEDDNVNSHVPSSEEIPGIVEKLNHQAAELNSRITFSFHEKTRQVIMKVINADTNEIIEEIPAKDLVKVLEHLKDFLGMFVDESR
jgi:flagellar protein FlaG